MDKDLWKVTRKFDVRAFLSENDEFLKRKIMKGKMGYRKVIFGVLELLQGAFDEEFVE
jgi:hypothetical protein